MFVLIGAVLVIAGMVSVSIFSDQGNMYHIVYTSNKTIGTEKLRTGVFLTGVTCCMALFVRAGAT